ncbi:efflux RND transporter periplasmic adaptor subunit [Jannaschia formosa]|uniref:efflux RND transporter periplasmic adaptor subunit n=1 Tax=Jannaschia formosa TaxID=2259592 RepID=UPI000E1BBC40|nr:efflux RND transporter periplasmic adaptor subunit [Jannaschia formosa]TFL16024.1 efflux RND transporter periplasmic adaptor subunit [Jannaschia formosa]
MTVAVRVALVLALLAAPGSAQEGIHVKMAEARSSASLPAISVSPVAPARLRDRVIASGLVAAVEEVQVQPLLEGQPIETILAEVGDRVQKGQVLARLSTATLELQRSELEASRAQVLAAVAQAEATLAEAQTSAAEAERVAARDTQLAEQGSLPGSRAEESRASADAARARAAASEQGIASAKAQGALVEAQIDTLELQLARSEVTAPVGGLIVARSAQIGAVASASGSALFTIVRDGALELRAEVSEQDLLRLRLGQTVTMSASTGAQPVTGKVRLVEPSIDQATRLGTARIAIDDPERVVRGMFLTAEILVREADALAVPVTAVRSGGDESNVMRVRGNLVESVPVATGIRDGALIEITRGLGVGDQVVTRAAAFVRDGDRVNPVVDGAGPAADMAAEATEPDHALGERGQ